MPLRRTGLILLLALAILLAGCKKKEKSVPPPEANAPTLPTPPAQSELPPPPPLPPLSQPAQEPQPEVKKPSAKKPKKKPQVNANKTAPAPAPVTPEKKTSTVVREGTTGANANGQLSAGLPPAAEQRQRQSTIQLQQSAESNLRNLTRSLSDDEQAMVQQIRAYLQQSRTADADGDVQRAYNLALKANLLSNDLVRR
jgi:outer membrane biosynthesis protein TonB